MTDNRKKFIKHLLSIMEKEDPFFSPKSQFYKKTKQFPLQWSRGFNIHAVDFQVKQ